MTALPITLNIADATFATLKSQGYNLFGMIGVTSSNKSGKPAVVICSNQYLQSNAITLSDQLTAYASTSQNAANMPITIGSRTAVKSGQVAVIDAYGSIATGAGSAAGGTVYILNNASCSYTSGLARSMSLPNTSSQAVPAVAFDTPSSLMVTMDPVGSALFFFGTPTYNAGVILTICFGPGVAINLANAPTNGVTLTYDLDLGGWVTNNAPYLTTIAAASNIVPVLIQPPGTDVPARAAMAAPNDRAAARSDAPLLQDRG